MVFLEYKGRSATTRMRIVQSLVVSDLVLGYVLSKNLFMGRKKLTDCARITGLTGTAMTLSGDGLVAGTTSCDGLGLLLVAVIWTRAFLSLVAGDS